MAGRRGRWTEQRSGRRRAGFQIEVLERRYALDGAGPRPFIDLGASDNVALDQPRVTVEFGDATGSSIGPDMFNSWLLDTGANTILAFKTAIDDMDESPPLYQVEGLFEELGIGGSQAFDISIPYQLDFAGTSGVRQTLVDARIISDATRDVSMFGPFGIVGMPAMTGRVTTLDFTPWLTFGDGNFLMATEFAAELPAPAGPRYSITVDNRVSFAPEGQVIEGDHPPVWADIPFFSVEVHHGGKTVASNFMFDTGAQVTIISTATAMGLGLDSNGDGLLDATDTGYTRSESVGGVGGSREAPVFMIDAVHVPTDQGIDLTWSELQWLVADIAPGIDGVFGFDNMTSGWIDAVFSSGGAGAILQSQLDFRGWDETGSGKIYFDLNPDIVAVQNPTGAGGVIVEPGGTTTVSESGDDDTYSIALRQRPTADVLVDLVVRPGQLSAHLASAPEATTLRFTPDTWNIPQSVVVHAVDDSTEQSLHRSSVRHVVRSADPAYDGVGFPSVLVNIVDNDFPAVMILPTAGETDVAEGGGADTYALVLMRQPTGDVTVTPQPADGQVRAASAADGSAVLVFTPANWNQPQGIRVAAVDDNVIEGPHRTYINHQISTTDPGYSEAYVLPEIVFITDNDLPAPTPPTVSASLPSVSGNVGGAITASGGWGSTDPGTTVSLSASIGTVTRLAGGAWTWSLAPQTPLGREPVTITATDDRGLTATATFTVTARAAPSAVSAVAGDRLATVTWKGPAAPLALPTTGYFFEQSLDDGVTWQGLPAAAPADTSLVVAGLVNGRAYRFRVAAGDADGIGPWSEPTPVVVPIGVPAAATSLAATPGNGQVRLAWLVPADAGGLPITDYVIESSTDGGARWKTVADGASAAPAATISGLANGTVYAFRIAAVNAAGRGAFTPASPAAIPALPAGLPTALKATRGNGTATLVWKAPSLTGGSPINDYALQLSSDAGRTWKPIERPASPATTATVSGLVNGTPYVFRIAAVNSVGPASFTGKTLAVVPATTAGVATVPVAARRSGQVTLSWSAPPSTGGLAIIDYLVQSSRDGGRTWTPFPHKATAATAATVTGLANGTPYIFRVAAVNGVGVGAFTGSTAAVVPATLAGVPTALKAIRGNSEVQLTWKAPATDGGAPILSYFLQLSSDGGRTWATPNRAASTATAAVITGLVNGTSYVFRVAALTDVGTGPSTAKTAAVVPATLPGLPTGLVVARVAGGARLDWVAPLSAGGSALVDYAVDFSSDGGVTWKRFAHKPSTKSTATLTGLPNGISLAFRVAAVNAIGAGAPAGVSLAPK